MARGRRRSTVASHASQVLCARCDERIEDWRDSIPNPGQHLGRIHKKCASGADDE